MGGTRGRQRGGFKENDMKKLMIVGVASLAALCAAGCKEKSTPKGTTDALKDAAKNAANSVGDLAARAKEETVAAAQDLYESTAAEVDQLAKKVSESSSEQKPAWQKLVDDVKAQLGEAKTKLEAMRPDDADWKKLSSEFTSIMTKVGDSIKSLVSQVK